MSINPAQLMRKSLTPLVLLLLITVSPPLKAQFLETNSFSGLNTPIPAGNPAGVASVQTVNSAITSLSSVRVSLNVAGNFNGDLYAYLRHVQGGVTNFCVLLNRAGRSATNAWGYADCGFNVFFDDAAGQGDVHSYQAVEGPAAGTPLAGVWQTDGRDIDPTSVLDTTPRSTSLGSFTNCNPSGTWTLFLAGISCGSTNTLVSWELVFSGSTPSTLAWATPANITYGTPLGPAQLNASSSLPGVFTYDLTNGTVLNAGSQPLWVTFTPDNTNSYAPITTNVTLSVEPALLTITPEATNKPYGAPLPGLTAAYSGFVNGDSPASLSTLPLLATTATASSPVGNYPITASGVTASNYVCLYNQGTLSVIKANASGLLTSSANPSLPGQGVTFGVSIAAVAPGAGTPSGAVQFEVDGVPAGPPVPLNAGTASFTANNLVHGRQRVSCVYLGDGNFLGVTNLLSPAQLVNTPPVARAASICRGVGEGAMIGLPDLLANVYDADGDAITLVSVGPTSANGGSVTISGGWVVYSPPPGSTAGDSFSYQATDGWCAPVTGTVKVIITQDAAAPRSLAIISLGGGSVGIGGQGSPGKTYVIQYAEKTLGTTEWLTLGTVTADASGAFTFAEPASSGLRFYRAILP